MTYSLFRVPRNSYAMLDPKRESSEAIVFCIKPGPIFQSDPGSKDEPLGSCLFSHGWHLLPRGVSAPCACIHDGPAEKYWGTLNNEYVLLRQSGVCPGKHSPGKPVD